VYHASVQASYLSIYPNLTRELPTLQCIIHVSHALAHAFYYRILFNIRMNAPSCAFRSCPIFLLTTLKRACHALHRDEA